MIKTTVAEWKAFHNDSEFWGEFAVEDEQYTVNGVPLNKASWDFDPHKFKDNDKIEIDGGYVWDQGPTDATCDLASFFRRWKKRQTHEYVVLLVPKDRVSAVKAAALAAAKE